MFCDTRTNHAHYRVAAGGGVLPWLCCLLLGASLMACESRLQPQNLVPETELLVGEQVQQDIDFLFVVDNSMSMGPWQEILSAQVPEMIMGLNDSDGGFPNVHVGVVSSDLGAGSGFASPMACASVVGQAGRGGVLQPMRPDVCGDPDGCSFIEDIGNANCTDPENPMECRTRNYREAQIDEVFNDMVMDLTVSGCEYTEPLEAMRLALDSTINDDFLRPQAALVVVVITDGDDCSILPEGQGVADPDDASLGNSPPMRCFEHGVVCDPDEPRSPGEKSNCSVRDDSPYIADITGYVQFLLDVKGGDPDTPVLLRVISGPSDPVRVDLVPSSPPMDMQPLLAASCSFDDEPMGPGARSAVPSIRLNAVVTELNAAGGDAQFIDICEDGVADSLAEIVSELNTQLEGTCLTGQLFDTDDATLETEPRCSVIESDPQGNSQPISRCEGDMPTTPCFRTVVDTERCTADDHDTNLKLIIDRGEDIPTPGTIAAMACDISQVERNEYTKESYYGCAAVPGGAGPGAPLLLLGGLLWWARRRVRGLAAGR